MAEIVQSIFELFECKEKKSVDVILVAVDQTLLNSLVKFATRTVSVCVRCALRQHGATFYLIPILTPMGFS